MASLLITQTEVIKLAFTNQNVKPAQIKDTFIEVAQLEHIKPVLTKDLYNDILANPNSVANKPLIPMIKKALAFFTKYEALPDMHIEATANGLQVNSNEFGTASSDAGRAVIRKTALYHGQTFKDDLIDFIEDEDNRETYEDLYDSPNSVNNKATLIGGISIIKVKQEESIDRTNTNSLI